MKELIILLQRPIFAQISTSSEIDILELITHSGPVVTAVLIILVLFSIGSWAVIIYKFLQFRKAFIKTNSFINMFWESRRLDEIYENSIKYIESPVARVFRAGYNEMIKVKKKLEKKEQESGSMGDELSGLDNITRAMKRSHTAEITHLESLVPFLATTGSTTPFIGLFGTVWGIMVAFQDIGRVGSANLATVAPGISEALIATATGLAAAIPAVIAYNYFNSKIKVLDAEMESFTSDFLNIIKRHFM
ncbi:MAG: protein TolQ [Deltaproteobacteria bacterium]|nr:protein TolQ [Deltaproteobacteria bacterium]